MQAGGETQIRNNSRRLYGCNKPLSGGLRYDGRKHGHRPDERAGETGFEAYKGCLHMLRRRQGGTGGNSEGARYFKERRLERPRYVYARRNGPRRPCQKKRGGGV